MPDKLQLKGVYLIQKKKKNPERVQVKIYMCVFGVLEWKEGDKFKLIFKHYLVNSTVLIVESVRRKKNQRNLQTR